MATGFILRHFIALLLVLASLPALAVEVALTGTFGTTAAILSIDGGAPRTVKVGATAGGVTVVSVERDKAVVEVEGKRMTLLRGQGSSGNSAPAAGKTQSVKLTAGFGGHYAADGQVNGKPVRFIVDTGATSIALPGSVATQLGIDYRSGPAGTASTASGTAVVYRVRLDTVRIGAIELNGVEAVVIEQGLQTALLGMSFLSRVEMKHDGQSMTLERRF